MGFMKGLGKFVAEMGTSWSNMTEESKQQSFEWRDESDAFLVDKCKSGKPSKKMAAFKVLKDRYPDAERRKMILERYW